MSPRVRALALVLVTLAATLVARSAVAAPPVGEGEPLIVAVKEAPPFSLRRGEDEWAGPSIELWRELAAELELDYELRETTLDDMLAGVAEGRYQAAVAAITVTSEREEIVDFTHPFYTTGLAIAVLRRDEVAWRSVLDTVLSRSFLQLIASLALLQLVVGTVVWTLERRANPEQFPPGTAGGVATGFWWATVTMTTVGYGDKTPKSALGRVIALLWMLASMIILASVTATIASSLTIERLDSRIRGPGDLHRFEVGAIRGTTGALFLEHEKIVAHSYPDSESALAALREGEIEALVWDAPLLRAAARARPQLGIELVGGTFQRQDYAIAVGEGSELREAINRVLPEKIRDASFSF